MNSEMLIKDLVPYLPHRPPMVWVTHVLEVGKDYREFWGTCGVEIDRKALYVNNSGEIRASSAIEFTAQGFGYLKAAYQVIHNFKRPPSETYLTGVRSCRADFSDLNLDEVPFLEVHISVLRELLPLTYVRGVIRRPGSKEVLAETEIQVYVVD